MYLTKGELIGIILVILVVLGYKTYHAEEKTPAAESNTVEDTSELDEAFDEAWEAQGEQYTDDTSLVDPFAPDTWLDSPINPGLGLTIIGDEPPCVDTHLRTDVSCADKEAVLKFRNALHDAETQRLKLEVERLERKAIYEEFGLREC